MLYRRDGIVLEFDDACHASDDDLERYAMGRLAEPDLRRFEEHLFQCESCQNRLADEDMIRHMAQLGGIGILQETRAPRRPRIPAPLWSGGLVAIALILLAVLELPRWRHADVPPAVVMLGTMRGMENAIESAAPAAKPLLLSADLKDLPHSSQYVVDVVDAAGHAMLQSAVTSENNTLQIPLAKGLKAGVYYVRLYSPARELLREYTLMVRG